MTRDRLETVRPGDPLLARRQNTLVRAVRAMAGISGADAVVDATGPHLRPRPAALVAQMMRLERVEHDYLVCRVFDGVTPGTADVAVAKPHQLRRATWHGLTDANGWSYTYPQDATGGYSRSAEKQDQTTEWHVIEPAYTQGDLLLAVRVPGGTGVLDESGRRVVWADLNADGRYWMEAPDA